MATSSPPRASVTPLGAATAAAVSWRFKGELRVTAIVKATFAFASDTAMPRVAPQEIIRAEIHHGAVPSRSVRFTTDLIPRLLQADVLWTGHAHAPHGRPVDTLPVRLGLFSSSGWTLLDKTLIVRKRGGFVRLPIDHEHAYGGLGFPENPFGVGHAEGSGEPNILDPRDGKRVAGFGPISQAMPARRRLLGAAPRALLEREIAEIPDDLCWEYFQAAPPDQRTPLLRGDEWIVMDGLHPSAPRARMRLPGARGFARVHGLSDLGVDEREALPLSADVLRIDGDEQRCTVTWRGSFPVPTEGALSRVRILAGVELPGEPIAWPAPGAAIHGAGAAGPGLAPRSGADDGGGAALESTPEMSPEASRTARLDGTIDLADRSVAVLPAASTLPFRPAPAGASPLAQPAPPPLEAPVDRSRTVPLPKEIIDFAASLPATPFAAATPPAATPTAATPPAPPAATPTAATPPAPPAATPTAATPTAATPPAPPAAGRAFAWSTPPPEPPPPGPSAGPPKRPAKLDVKALLYGPGKRQS
ncbi:DUF2169 family type VI secretion system accessory protein [Sorangium sp. So ce1335]|uniref:DUF2169 family type VI secretion system accessory protein n=1 Tax=Sorangium sp. So ce1335 TaxID=3133335 RepID=UPI003F61298E